MWIRLKLFFVYAVIVAGSVVIFILQWHEAVAKSGFGSSGYTQGLVGTIMLALIMAGIPIVFWAVLVYLALCWLLFRSGELEAHKARQVIAEVSREMPHARSTKPLAGRTFED